MTNNYINFIDTEDIRFYTVPDSVMHDYRLSLEAVTMYSLLYRRCQLSAYNFIKNDKDYTFEFWDNKRDTVFCIYTIEELEPKLRKKKTYIKKVIKELKDYGYIEVVVDRSKSNANKYFLKEGNKKVLSVGSTKDLT